MFNSFTTKFKSLIFTPQPANSRKRKRSLDESDDPDCEIIEVKRPKNTPETQQFGYNFFSKMADWVRNKTSWEKMFDFKPVNRPSVKMESEQDETDKASSSYQQDRLTKHNGNGLSSKNRMVQGQRENGPRVPVYRNMDQQSGRQQKTGGHVLNGDGRETPPNDTIQEANCQPVGRKTYASVVKSSKTEPKGDNYHNNTTVSNSTQTTYNGHTFTDNQYSCSTQRSLFSRKPDIHFTVNDTVRLEERERYKTLLQQYTTIPLRTTPVEAESTHNAWPSLDKSKRLEDTVLGNKSGHYVTKLDISQSVDIPRHRVIPKHIQPSGSLLQRHISPLDMIKSSSLGSSTVHSPTSIQERPLLESTRVVESHSETVISPEKESILCKSDRNTTICDYRNSQYLSENWASDLMSKYSSAARDRNRKIAEAEIKARLYEERRKGKDDDIEKRLRVQMRLYEKEPAVTEDLPVEVEEEEKEEVLPEITPEMDDIINKALRGQPAGEVLVEGYRLQITRGDIATLAGLNWLNDEVINFYMNMLMERGEKDTYPKCYAFNTFFYPKIMSGGQAAVKRWTKKVDIFSYDYIIIPVHLGMHWCLCIVDFKKKSIQYYDSMGGNNTKCLTAVKQYLCDECKEKKNQAFDTNGWTTEIVEDIPQQMNGSDCGMFACKFADYITRDAKITFSQQHMPYFRRRMVYEIVKKQLLQ